MVGGTFIILHTMRLWWAPTRATMSKVATHSNNNWKRLSPAWQREEFLLWYKRGIHFNSYSGENKFYILAGDYKCPLHHASPPCVMIFLHIWTKRRFLWQRSRPERDHERSGGGGGDDAQNVRIDASHLALLWIMLAAGLLASAFVSTGEILVSRRRKGNDDSMSRQKKSRVKQEDSS